MSFLGLGSFGEGFVKGFAESANEALKRDIERINNRIDKVADIRFERALKQQEKRQSDVDATVNRLKQGVKIIGDDNPDAEAYAAGLLEEYGTAGYDALLGKLQEAKINKGIDVATFFQRAGIDAPGQGGQAYSLRDYAEAYLGAPKTLPSSIKIPADTSRAGGLIGSVLGVDVDISGRAQRQSAAEIAAMGVSDTYDASIVIPRTKFNRFEFDLAVLPYEQRITTIDEELSSTDPSAPSPVKGFQNRVGYLKDLREKEYTAMINTGDVRKSLEARIKLRDSYAMSDPRRQEENDRIIEGLDAIKRQDATDKGDDVAIMQLDASKAYREGSLTEFRRLMDEISFRQTGDRPSINDLLSQERAKLAGLTEGTKAYNDSISEIKRLEEISLVGVQQGITTKIDRLQQKAATLTKGTTEYNDVVAEIEKLKNAQTIGDNVTVSGLNTARIFLDNEIDLEASKNLGAIGSEYLTISRQIANGSTTYDALTSEQKAIYDQGKAERKKVELQVFNKITSTLDLETNRDIFALGVQRGYITNLVDKDTTDAVLSGAVSTGEANQAATTASAQTAQALSKKPTTKIAEVSLSQDEINAYHSVYPDTSAGAEKMVAKFISDGKSYQDIINDPKVNAAYGDEFKQTLKYLSEGGIDYSAAGAEEEEADSYGTPQQMEAMKILRRMPMLQRMGSRLQIDKLSKELNISESEAKKLFESLENIEFSSSQQVDQAKDIVDTVMGTDVAEIRAIAKELNISMDRAKQLHQQVSPQKRFAGGLMSRK